MGEVEGQNVFPHSMYGNPLQNTSLQYLQCRHGYTDLTRQEFCRMNVHT